ncbi:hypothetical protein NKR19_g2825 [Coniochaeta hoffmannii]|uniref:Uncharacterized protein n=1 Tax=Coniochaeta hoffmannii TaxID=91930 RepID=A0AA38VRU2_9PEZI|nr:hypothetical protein NKR19_g2825 [Coniochaeta hoffmannii]
MTRADECRLMFLSQSLDHTHTPIMPSPPFGTKAFADCTLEVWERACCGCRHQPSYAGWTWDCRMRRSAFFLLLLLLLLLLVASCPARRRR